MSMQEAFNRAVKRAEENKLDLPMVRVIRDVDQARKPERIKQREEEQFAQLKEEYYTLGRMWFNTKIDKSTDRFYRHDGIPIEQKRKQWLQALTSLNEKPAEQRIELLSELASGMLLREDNFPTIDAKYGRIFRFSPLVYSGLSEPLGISFTRPSIFFMENISGMSDHSIEQKKEFRDFMVREAGLKEKVGLRELFPGISRWLDHSNSRSSSHSSTA